MKLPYTGYLQPPTGAFLVYYISDRRQFPGNAEEKRRRLLNKISECAAAQVDYIQLREKDLSTRALEDLARAAIEAIPPGSRTRLLINSRTDVALACRSCGVHLPSDDLPASEVRAIFGRVGNIHPVIAVSTHTTNEIAYAESHGADFAVFGPVFEKDGAPAQSGLNKLRHACNRPNPAMPVLALGGVTLENAEQCLAAGANGIGGIRLFQDGDVARVVRRLREIQLL